MLCIVIFEYLTNSSLLPIDAYLFAYFWMLSQTKIYAITSYSSLIGTVSNDVHNSDLYSNNGKSSVTPWMDNHQCIRYLWTTAILSNFIAAIIEINLCNRKKDKCIRSHSLETSFVFNGFIALLKINEETHQKKEINIQIRLNKIIK